MLAVHFTAPVACRPRTGCRPSRGRTPCRRRRPAWPTRRRGRERPLDLEPAHVRHAQRVLRLLVAGVLPVAAGRVPFATSGRRSRSRKQQHRGQCQRRPHYELPHAGLQKVAHCPPFPVGTQATPKPVPWRRVSSALQHESRLVLARSRAGRYNVRVRRLAVLLVLLLPSAASASDGALFAAREMYLPAAKAGYANTPDGAQARYEAGRNLVEAVLAAGPVSAGRRALRADLLARGRAQVARAEALDRDDGFRSAGPLARLPGASAGVGRAVRTPVSRAAWRRPPRKPTGPLESGSTSSDPGATPATRRTPTSRPPRRSSSAHS